MAEKSRENIDIFISDEELVENLGMTGQALTSRDSRPIFSGEPAPIDVQQCNYRSTCYMMSMLAAYAASPTGKQILKAMVCSTGDNHALVTFYDPLIERNIQVKVSTARLVDKKGRDLYAFGNPTQARWAGIIEKAYHAYKISRSETIKAEIEKARANNQGDRAITYSHEHGKIAPINSKRSLLDRCDPLQSIGCLPILPEITDRPKSKYSYRPGYLNKFSESDFEKEETINVLRYNVKLGVPVTLCTDDQVNLKSAYRALFSSTTTDHAIAVVGPAKMIKGGKPVQGVMVFDQYGASIDGGVEINAGNLVLAPDKTPQKNSTPSESEWEVVSNDQPSSIQTKPGGRSLRFYSYAELGKYFKSAYMACGFYN